jgi:hypothetical protein
MRSLALLLLVLAPAAALRCAPIAAPAVVRAIAPAMALPSIDDAKNLTEEELVKEIDNAKKVRDRHRGMARGGARPALGGHALRARY